VADYTAPVTTGITTTFITARAAGRRMAGRGSGVILALNSGSAYASPMMGGVGPDNRYFGERVAISRRIATTSPK